MGEISDKMLAALGYKGIISTRDLLYAMYGGADFVLAAQPYRGFYYYYA